MKKGFTLIELLAVIVILAIIALIVTPMILPQFEDEYNKIVCTVDGKIRETNIDEVINNSDKSIKFKSDGKIYEFSKNNCYLVKE